MSDLKKLEEEAQFEADVPELPPTDIVAYNELRSCADLYRMHTQGKLEISPDFQRDLVWPGPAQTRFIDSLIKRLPIPSMCFGYDHKAEKWLVIDGLQRISTIVRFLKGEDWKLSKLDDIDPEIAGVSVAAIKTSDDDIHRFYERVENLTIPITVLRCDYSKKNHMEYIFTIFHRLNTGGMKLNNQEIRNCIFGGPFNRMLRELDDHKSWRKLNRMKSGESYRFTKQELMLRFFAFSDRRSKYTGHLAKFLNDYMHDNRYESGETLDRMRTYFKETVDCVYGHVFEGNPPSKMSITLLEATLVGVGKNVDQLSQISSADAASRFEALRAHSRFSESSLTEGLSKKARVIDRLGAAIGIFSGREVQE